MDGRVLCVRPTCGAAARAALHYDYAARTVWLEDLSSVPEPGAWPICPSHADTLRVPSGWRLVDTREEAGGGAADSAEGPLAV